MTLADLLMWLGALTAVAAISYVFYLILKAIWNAIMRVRFDFPDFVGKVFVSLGASVVAGLIGAIFFGLELKMAGGVGLIGAVGAAAMSRS